MSAGFLKKQCMNCFWLIRALGGKTFSVPALRHSWKLALVVVPLFNWAAFSKAVFVARSSSHLARANLDTPVVAFFLVMQRTRQSMKLGHSSGVPSLKYTMGMS